MYGRVDTKVMQMLVLRQMVESTNNETVIVIIQLPSLIKKNAVVFVKGFSIEV